MDIPSYFYYSMTENKIQYETANEYTNRIPAKACSWTLHAQSA
jgi:hypothetical protein